MSITPPSWSRGKSLCAYCGVALCTTGDHVIPKTLYTAEAHRERESLTVPACQACNADKSRFDNYLRDYLLINVTSSEHPIAKAIFNTKMEKAITTGRVRLLDRFDEGRLVPAFSEHGVHMNYAIPANPKPVGRALNYLVRGLHYAAFDQTRSELDVRAYILDKSNVREDVLRFASRGVTGSFSQGEPFQAFWFSGGAHWIRWLLILYGTVGCTALSRK